MQCLNRVYSAENIVTEGNSTQYWYYPRCLWH